jgi:hypothetical protein
VRHLVSILLGPILGFVVYVLLGYAAFKVQLESGWSGDNAVGILAMVAAGVAYAVLVVARLSPLGPALAGFAFLGLGMWIVSDLSSFVSTMPNDLLGIENAGFGPGLYLIPLSIPLLATLVSPNRWAGRPRPAMVGAPAAPPPPAYTPPPAEPQFDSGYGNQPAGYSGAPPIGAPYSGPPSYDSQPQYGPPPGSPVGYPEQGQQYGGQHGYPQDPMRPDITRRIQ